MKPILVIGSINMDVAITVQAMPESGEALFCDDVNCVPGGKGANQASAVSNLNYPAVFAGRIGKDAFGDILTENLKKSNINLDYSARVDEQTGVAYIFIEKDGSNRMIVNPGANLTFTTESLKPIADRIDSFGMIVMQLEIPIDCVSYIMKAAKEKGVPVLIDAGPVGRCDMEALRGAWCISPNETELKWLTKTDANSEDEILAGCRKILEYDVDCVLFKRGGKGSLYVDKDRVIAQKPYNVKVVDTTGAGDAFTAGFAVSHIRNGDIEEALDFASRVAAICVSTSGARVPDSVLEDAKALLSKQE